MNHNPLMPHMAEIIEIVPETDDGTVKTFAVEMVDEEAFAYRPGQCAMLSVLGVGECMLSISSNWSEGAPLEFSVQRVGRVTGALHQLEPGHRVGVRGPYGNAFPIDDWKGKNVLFIGGGIGLAPLRPVINRCLQEREEFGKMHLVYGARTPGNLCFKRELYENWGEDPDIEVSLTVDEGDDDWEGAVALVPHYLEELAPSDEDTVAITCGPPIMIRFTIEALQRLGFSDDRIVTTLELKMQCGVGKCGRCNIGSKYVCVDGPVFTYEQLKSVPQEY